MLTPQIKFCVSSRAESSYLINHSKIESRELHTLNSMAPCLTSHYEWNIRNSWPHSFHGAATANRGSLTERLAVEIPAKLGDKTVIQFALFDVSRFHSDRPNWSFEPTICPVAESCTLSALHNSTSGQIAAQLISYSLKPVSLLGAKRTRF